MAKNFATRIADLLAGNNKPVTAALMQWDGKMTREAILRVAELEIEDNRDRSLDPPKPPAIYPSMIGHMCDRKIVLHLLNFPSVDGDTTLAEDGKQQHYVWQKKGLSAPFLLDIEKRFEIPEWRLRGRMDGILLDGGVFEFKETGPKIYRTIVDSDTPLQAHLVQVHTYMNALGVDRASLVYECRSYGVDYHEVPVHYDLRIEEMIDDKIERVMNHVSDQTLPKQLPKCAVKTGGIYQYCGFRDICASAKIDKGE